MENCENYFNWGSLVVPILVVLIGGGLAFWQMNYRNKQERINKWKEEFRGYMSEYMHTVLDLNFTLNLLGKDISMDRKVDPSLIDNSSAGTNKLMAVIAKIEMLLEYKTPSQNKLIETFHNQWDFVHEAQKGNTDKFKGDLLSDVMLAAKDVHREYKG
ncbi:hypothetical protein GCM10007103_25870 [Salinimicrobium marinum]|uniref:Uncharacterized protein n=1 Tax=Salinimicrobium marinum TaxID=680283 RepID=A0A918W026_9FLAO|nr:hypothetical protein [Salinimicrobium marinum]GHA43543.1 hypothetical protein GCM10007103_25870 [Salinimicrobium marinum]